MKTNLKSRNLLIALGVAAIFFTADCMAVNEALSLSIQPAQSGATTNAKILLVNPADVESFTLQLTFASGGILSLPSSGWFQRGDYFPSTLFGPEPRVELNHTADAAAHTNIYLDGFNPSGNSGQVGQVALNVSGTTNSTQVVTLSGEFWSRSEQTVKTLVPISVEFKIGTIADQTVSFVGIPSVVVGGTDTVVATGGGSGNTVIIASQTTNVCTVSGNTLSGVAAGTCTLQANQAGNATYNPAPTVTESFTVGKGNQTITFGAAPTLAVGRTGTVTATGGASGNLVTFTSQTLNVCSVVGNTVTGSKAGVCTLAANQLGNMNYNAATQVTQNINVTIGLTLTVTNFNKPYGTITSNTGGIACGATCATTIASGSRVTLVAMPVAGYQFSGWGGDCSGYGNSCVVTIDATKSVTAKFEIFKKRQSIWKRILLKP